MNELMTNKLKMTPNPLNFQVKVSFLYILRNRDFYRFFGFCFCFMKVNNNYLSHHSQTRDDNLFFFHE